MFSEGSLRLATAFIMPSTDGFPADEAKLVSIFVQSCLWGIFTVLFFGSLSVLRKGVRNRNGMHRVMLGTAITMWVVATAHLGVNFSRIIEAFVIHRNDEGGPASYFNILSNFSNLFGSALYQLQTLVGDAFLLYRLALVWNHNWRITGLPLLLLSGSTASAIGTLYSFAKASAGVVFRENLSRWIISFFVLTLATNLICTILIAARIWTINRFTTHIIDNSNLKPVMLVILESGAIYSCTLITLLACYLSGSWAQYLILDAVSSIVGIVFSMVILRLGMKLSEPDGTTVEFRDTNTRSTLWNAPHLRYSEGIKLHVAVDRAVHADSLKNVRKSDTDDERSSPSWQSPA